MLTKWIIDGRKKPWPTSELFVGYDSHESVRSGQKLRPRLVHASIARGIIFKSPFFIFFAYFSSPLKDFVKTQSTL